MVSVGVGRDGIVAKDDEDERRSIEELRSALAEQVIREREIAEGWNGVYQ